MRAMIVYGPRDIRYADIEKPLAGPHEVVSKVVCCGICGTDIEIFNGDTSLAENGLLKYPVRIGHEWAGIVESVGSEVKDFRPGDRVISDTGSSCGHCEHCLGNDFRKCGNINSLGTVGNCKEGAFAEYIVMYDWHMHKIPDNVSFEEATLAEPGTIALNALMDCGIHAGQSICITGTGAIGLLAASFAKQLGARVLLAGRKKLKLDIGTAMGADAVINTSETELVEFLMEHTGGRGVDIFLDTTGVTSFVHQALNATAFMGTIGLLGFGSDYLEHFDINRLVMEHKRILGCEGSAWRAPQVLDLISKGQLSIKPMITGRVRFDDAAEVIRNARKDTARTIKTIVEISR